MKEVKEKSKDYNNWNLENPNLSSLELILMQNHFTGFSLADSYSTLIWTNKKQS